MRTATAISVLAMRPSARLRNAVVLWVGTVLFCWPALMNGTPLVFPDTRSYYVGGRTAFEKAWSLFSHVVATGGGGSTTDVDAALQRARGVRSAFYAVFVYSLGHAGLLWLVVALQALVTVWACQVAFRCLRPDQPPSRLLPVLAFLAALTSVAWSVSMVMPDAFTGVLVLTLVTLLVFWPDLTPMRRLLLAVASGGSIVMHASNLPLAVAVIAVTWLTDGRRSRQLVPARLTGTAACAMAAVAMLAASLIGFHKFTLFPQSPPYLLAQSIHDGPARLYLQRHCPQVSFEMCRHLDRFGDTPDDFLWHANGAYSTATPAERDRIRAESNRIVVAAAFEHPLPAASSAARHFVDQLVLFGLSDYVPGSRAEMTATDMISTLPDDLPHWTHVLSVIDYVVVIGSLIALAWFWKQNALDGPQRRFVTGLVVAVVLNAAFCGVLGSMPDARYQGRVVWLIPFAAAVLMVQGRRSGSSP